jgi:hypothetical protein
MTGYLELADRVEPVFGRQGGAQSVEDVLLG